MERMEQKDCKDGRCKGCEFARTINSRGNWEFIGCNHEPYKGKWVCEIKDCPKQQTKQISIAGNMIKEMVKPFTYGK